MGFLNIGGGKSKEEEKQKSTTDIAKTSTSTTDSTKTASTTGEEAQSSQVTLLDQQTQDLLKGLISQLGAGVGGEGTDFTQQIANLSSMLTGRAAGAESAIQAQIEPIVANARAKGETELGQSVTGLAQATGSSQNSLIQLLAQKGRNDLETQLAGLTAELNLKARETGTNEFQGALQALSTGTGSAGQDVNQIAALANILRGATATQTGTTTTTQASTEQNQISQLIDELQNIFTKSEGKGKTGTGSFQLSL